MELELTPMYDPHDPDPSLDREMFLVDDCPVDIHVNPPRSRNAYIAPWQNLHAGVRTKLQDFINVMRPIGELDLLAGTFLLEEDYNRHGTSGSDTPFPQINLRIGCIEDISGVGYDPDRQVFYDVKVAVNLHYHLAGAPDPSIIGLKFDPGGNVYERDSSKRGCIIQEEIYRNLLQAITLTSGIQRVVYADEIEATRDIITKAASTARMNILSTFKS